MGSTIFTDRVLLLCPSLANRLASPKIKITSLNVCKKEATEENEKKETKLHLLLKCNFNFFSSQKIKVISQNILYNSLVEKPDVQNNFSRK